MVDHTPAEQACFNALVAANGPKPEDIPYPACLMPIAEAATAAVIKALAEEEA